ncbi:MAG TPA: alpha/beta hydrolase-fold protein [Anaerolineales bacterium]|nr:alpha/beta hydrolase-fold protein [Anaerolineales bacterium]
MKKMMLLILASLSFSICLQACASNTIPSQDAGETPEFVEETPTIAPTAYPALGQDTIQTGQHPYSYLASTGEEIRYLMYFPEDYQLKEHWPLIVYLHGAGAVGKNIDTMLGERSLLGLLENNSDFEFIVLSPQLPSGRWGKYIDLIDELLSHLTESLPVDANHLYLTGISLGGLGAWQYALTYPDRFTALAPVGGAASFTSESVPENICTLKDLPIWIFHGEEDLFMKPEKNEAIASELEACGGNVKFTLFPGVNHMDTFAIAYEDPALYEWFLEQSK